MQNFVSHIRANVPARTASFAGSHGPIAWLGVNSLGRKETTSDNNIVACESIKRSFLNSKKNGGCDFYMDISWHPENSPPIEAPASTAAKLTVLDVGTLNNDVSTYCPNKKNINIKKNDDESEKNNNNKETQDEETTKLKEQVQDLDKEVPLDLNTSCTRDTDFYQAVSATVANLCEKGYIPLTIADSPHVTVAAMEGIRQVGHDNVVLTHFSADTRMGGSADAPLKRILERNLSKGVIQFGNRTVGASGRAIRKKYDVRYADAHALFDRGIFTLKDIRNQFPVYVSVDLSVLEPCYAPGVTDPEGGGFTTRELLHMLAVLRAPNVIGMEIVGYEPENDVYRKCGGDGITSITAAKCAKEMIMKALTCSGKTRHEIGEYVKQQKLQGNHPGSYPDH